MKDFRKQKVWQKAHDLALEVYRVTEAFPKTELFGLTSQIRRAGVSIPDYERLNNQTTEVKQMLTSFIKKLKADSKQMIDREQSRMLLRSLK